MAGLFEISDFALFDQYANKTQAEAPDGHGKLRPVYDKLGKIIDGLKKLGYHVEITRNPLMQAGKALMKYAEYHWSRVYPKEENLYRECQDKVFFVVGTTSAGVNIHIDSNTKKKYYCNAVSKAIKEETWLEIPPQEASLYTCDELVCKVDAYIKDHWMEFNRFAKEFGIKESIKNLNNMEIEQIKKLLIGNHNIILTGAPGTGKTYLAKQIAESIGATGDACKLVQFHPSYDYTDFVEGLRPVNEKGKLGFIRQDGVFKEFCKQAIRAQRNISIDDVYNMLVDDINNHKVSTIDLKTKKSAQLFVTEKNNIRWYSPQETDNISSNVVSLSRIKELYSRFNTIDKLEAMVNIQKEITDLIDGCDATYYWGVLHYLLEKMNLKNIPPYVFIIDEINRGDISKIFGELFCSIDSGYRGVKGRVQTQYQNLVSKKDVFYKGFYVPENVYIIGTMNDIDRSVESMDFAMRRRFAWKEITVESRQSMLDDDAAWEPNGKPDQTVIKEIKVRMNNLNSCIIDQYGNKELAPKDKIGLTKAYQIGASYFLKYALYDNFDDLWHNHIEGLLYEYLRGSANAELKMNRLHNAYNDTVSH